MPSIDLGKVVGPKGATGATGPQGIQGPQGLQGPPGYGVIPGGAENSFLAKNSAVDYDTKWMTLPQIGSELVKADNPVGAALSGKASNPNLLDNWYLADAINQMGQTEYAGGPEFWNSVYTIDRWRTNGTATIMSDSIKFIANDYVLSIHQLLEKHKFIDGATYTFSTLLLGNTLIVGTGVINLSEPIYSVMIIGSLGNFTIKISAAENDYISASIESTAGAEVQIIASKLELGPVQTLAHQDADGNWVLNEPPPDKALELAKCQRYQKVYKNQDCVGIAIGNAILIQKPCMRGNATVTRNGAILTTSAAAECNVNTLTIVNAQATGAFAVCRAQNDFGTGEVFVKHDSPELLILDANL